MTSAPDTSTPHASWPDLCGSCSLTLLAGIEGRPTEGLRLVAAYCSHVEAPTLAIGRVQRGRVAGWTIHAPMSLSDAKAILATVHGASTAATLGGVQ